MALTDIDAATKHLYHPFRQKLARVLEAVAKETGEPWVMLEGYRSPERQLWLYAQGRTRPGKIVTWEKTLQYHGAGLAADCYPKRRPFSAPMALFETYRKIYTANGLCNPAWGMGDRGHVQWPPNDAMRLAALQWVRDGFPPDLGGGVTGDTTGSAAVFVEGIRINDADAFLDQSHVYAALRPLADAFDWVIAEVKKANGGWKARLISDTLDLQIPVRVNANKAYCEVNTLPVHAKWDGATQTVYLSEKP